MKNATDAVISPRFTASHVRFVCKRTDMTVFPLQRSAFHHINTLGTQAMQCLIGISFTTMKHPENEVTCVETTDHMVQSKSCKTGCEQLTFDFCHINPSRVTSTR